MAARGRGIGISPRTSAGTIRGQDAWPSYLTPPLRPPPSGVIENPGMGDRIQSESVIGFRRNPQVTEGLLVTAKKQSQCLAVGEVEVLRSRPAQCHHEALHPLAP